jgi:hypothetical protein
LIPKESKQVTDDEATKEARRKLLRLGAYVAPAILATLTAADARAQQQSCAPAGCMPNQCAPGCAPARCNPNVP